MHYSDAELEHDLRLRPGLDRRPRPRQPDCPIEAGGCEKVFREKLTGTNTTGPSFEN
jgi:hypothetical protein